ncbi:hypothetical protein [Lysinibacillus sp. UBA5990]|uniref:hypothetical protein n=1 Tax=Lysinibacillus sp. UBA5990 TaxID=1946773 RepID=UPI000E91F55F|nr:hypothetical protein [Lysinibacillus sp. UBA5990]HBJ00042.1 hypothetical protein [Lysinibacillus sp.]
MSHILREYDDDGYHVIEYTSDGKKASAITKTLIVDDVPEPLPIEPAPTVEEMQAQTLINTEYLITMNEMGIEGGKL